MNDSDLILAELRKITAWLDFQRKITKGALVFAGMMIVVIIVIGALADHEVKKGLVTAERPDWYQVDQSIRGGDFDQAIRIGEELIKKTPQYPEAHRRLAGAYLAAGKLEQARVQYAEACRLFPSEENEKLLAAMDKRIKEESAKP